MGKIPSEMLRGHMDTIILLSLLNCDKHTNQIREEIEERADGKFELKQGTFYSCLQRIVKLGYVTEYRSTSADGTRRKFYQLTEIGKNYIDENKDTWAFSRELINTLIQSSEPQSNEPEQKVERTEKPAEQKVTAMPEQKPAEPKVTRLETFEKEQTVEDVDQSLSEFLSTEDDEIVEDPKTDYADLPITSPGVRIIDFADFNSQNDASKRSNARREPKNKPDKSNEYTLFNIIDETSTTTSEPTTIIREEPAIVAPTVKPQEEVPTIEPEQKPVEAVVEVSPITEPVQSEPVVAEKPQPIENDDTNNPDEHLGRDYKTVLQSIFSTTKTQPVPQDPNSRVFNYTEGTDISEFLNSEPSTGTHQKTENLPALDKSEPEKTATKQRVTTIRVNDEDEPEEAPEEHVYDFSDIKSLAKTEGFKIKISTENTKRKYNKILINKLNLSAALMFFAIAVLEILIAGLTTGKTAGIKFAYFLIPMAVVAILPAYTAVMYMLAPNRKVSSIPTMKSVIELCAIIMLNVLLVDFVYCILANVDVSSSEQLVSFVFYPLLIILNIPVYFIIKYLKLDNQRFYE